MSTLQQNLVRKARNPFQSHNLTSILYPGLDEGYKDQYRAGWLPSWINEQWGGGPWGAEIRDGFTGSIKKITVLTGYIKDNTPQPVSFNNTTSYSVSQSFILSESVTNPAIWLKLYRVGNPTEPLKLWIYSDNAGVPNSILVGPITVGNQEIQTQSDGAALLKHNGDWYRVPITLTLSANTKYHILLSTNVTADASNYYVWRLATGNRYPHGNLTTGASPVVYTSYSQYSACFLVEAPAANALLQTGGVFDQKFNFKEGTPINQSRTLCKPLKEFWSDKEFTFSGVWSDLTKDKTFADFLLGVDHDRVVLRCNVTTGYPQLDVYDSSGTKRTVTGTVDVSSGNHQIGVYIRSKGDGQDTIKLYVDNVANGTPLTGLTLNFDSNMKELGTAWLGGGFNLAPTWTTSLGFTTLPSAQSWTWAGNATESSAMIVSGGKLYQTAGGYGSTQTGYYLRTGLGLNNTTGWAAIFKAKLRNSPNSSQSGTTGWSAEVRIEDGSKFLAINFSEGAVSVNNSVNTADVHYQDTFKNTEKELLICGQGSNYYIFLDGKLIVDGTNKLTTASASNQIGFGDFASGAGDNSDVVWSSVKAYVGGMILPQATSGSLSEFAYWTGNKVSYFSELYNQGAFVSAKQYCGLSKGYVRETTVQKITKMSWNQDVVSTTSANLVELADLSTFCLGSTIEGISSAMLAVNFVPTSFGLTLLADGVLIGSQNPLSVGTSAGTGLNASGQINTYIGLHYITTTWNVSGGYILSTGGAGIAPRQMLVKAYC